MSQEERKPTVPLSSNTHKARKSLTFNDFDMSFRTNSATGDLVEKRNTEAIKQALQNLVQLNKYDKPFHPEIAGGIRELLFEPYETRPDYYSGKFSERIKDLIKKYEPRVEVDSVDVEPRPDSNFLGVDITYTIVGSPRTVTNSFVLERLR